VLGRGCRDRGTGARRPQTRLIRPQEDPGRAGGDGQSRRPKVKAGGRRSPGGGRRRGGPPAPRRHSIRWRGPHDLNIRNLTGIPLAISRRRLRPGSGPREKAQARHRGSTPKQTSGFHRKPILRPADLPHKRVRLRTADVGRGDPSRFPVRRGDLRQLGVEYMHISDRRAGAVDPGVRRVEGPRKPDRSFTARGKREKGAGKKGARHPRGG